MEAYLDWQSKSGGIKLNDVIEEFKYVYKGQEVKAGDFVNYIEGLAGKIDYGESVDTQLSTEANSGYVISAVALDENRVFIAHSYGGLYYLRGVVVTIEGSIITAGEDVNLSSTDAGKSISATLLPSGNVFIAHSYSSTNGLYGIVVQIEGTTITKGTDTALVPNVNSVGKVISACTLTNGNVFIAHSYSADLYLYGIVCTISGTTITKGTDTAISTTKYAGSTTSTCLLTNGNVFIAHSYGSNQHLYGIVVTIDGTTITKGGDTAINSSTAYTGFRISAVTLDNGDVFIAHTGNNSYHLYCIVCSISGTTITKGTDTIISNTNTAGNPTHSTLLGNNNVLITHGVTTNLTGVLCKIDGKTVIVGTDTTLIDSLYSGAVICPLLLQSGTIFVAHGNTTDYYLNAQIFGIDYENNIPTNNIVITEYEQQVTPATEPPFNAVALSSGVGGPEFVEQEVEVKKTGDIIPKTWTKVSDYQYRADGVTLVASSIRGATEYYPYYACDGNEGTDYRGAFSEYRVGRSLRWDFDTPQKITKMYVYIGTQTFNYMTSDYESITIQGSNTGTTDNDFIDLFSIPIAKVDEYKQEIELSNTDYYKYYRIKSINIENTLNVHEWYVTEYAVKEIQQIPSTEHNEQVKIARLVTIKEINLIDNGDFENGIEGWTVVTNTTFNVVDGVAQISTPTYSDVGAGIYRSLNKKIIENHIYYVAVNAKAPSNIANSGGQVYAFLKNSGNNIVGDYLITDNNWHKMSMVYTGKQDSDTNSLYLAIYSATSNVISYWDNAMVIDLTAMFGAGNEPTKEWCDANLGGEN